VGPWLVRGLVFGTSVAVASYSWWLIPPYLAVMAFLLLEPAGRRVNATNPTEPETNQAADASRAAGTSDLVDEASLDSEKVVAESSAAGSTAVKTRRASKARTKKIRQAPELAPASWIQVAPGKFVRVEPGTEIPRDEAVPEPTSGNAVEESLAAPLAAEPVSNEAASEMGDTLADHLPQSHVNDFESDQPLTSDDDLLPDAVDPSPTADALNETASDIEAALGYPVADSESDETPVDEPANSGDEPLEADEFAAATATDVSETDEFQDVSESYAADAVNVEASLESPVENVESDEAETDESATDGDEPVEADEFVEAVATEFSDADEFEEAYDERAADDAEYEAEAVHSADAEYPAEPAFDCERAAEEEPVAVSEDDESDVAQDEESDEAYAESDAETTEFHDEAVARDADEWNDEIIGEEAEVDRPKPGAELSGTGEDWSTPLGLQRPIPPSRGNVRSARAHRLPSGFRRRSPRGVGRQRLLIRAFPPRSPP